MESSDKAQLQPVKDTVHILATELHKEHLCHLNKGCEPLPQQGAIEEIVALCRQLLFPGFFGNEVVNNHNIEVLIGIKVERLKQLLINQVTAALAFNHPCDKPHLNKLEERASLITMRFINKLPQVRKLLHSDVEAIYLGDPAAVVVEEVVYCYPSIKAITNYRLAHELLLEGVPILPRFISELAHSETGIDIHPAATIGHHFAIDHGTGVVIGATAIIGNHVKLYQGVTLGARSFDVDDDGNPIKGVPRHPIIGDNVIIYSNATVLGRITVGNGAIIGGNIWVTNDVAPGEKIVQGKREKIN